MREIIDLDFKTKEIMEKFKDFTQGWRVCMLINRGIGNTNKGSKRWVSKLVSFDPKTLEENIGKLLEQQYYLNDPDIRLYMCLNSRNIDKTIINFNHRMVDLYNPSRENA